MFGNQKRVPYQTIAKPLSTTACLKYRTQALGRENIPEAGPFILVAKHQGDLDALMVINYVPRQVTIVFRDDVGAWKKLLLEAWANMFSIKRNGQSRALFTESRAILQRGEAICLFPEGHRSRHLIGFHPGVALIARSNPTIPIIPIAVYNSEHFTAGKLVKGAFTWKEITARPTIRFGRAFYLPSATNGSREARKQDTALIRSKVAELMPKDLVGDDITFNPKGEISKAVVV